MGSHLARMLSGSGHEITVIDSDPKLLNEVDNLADLIRPATERPLPGGTREEYRALGLTRF